MYVLKTSQKEKSVESGKKVGERNRRTILQLALATYPQWFEDSDLNWSSFVKEIREILKENESTFKIKDLRNVEMILTDNKDLIRLFSLNDLPLPT